MEIKKEIGFATELVPLVKNHTKVLTYRLGNKYDFLKVGDVVQFSRFGFCKLDNKTSDKLIFWWTHD